MKILIATGGTGGHIYPALALADAAVKKYENCEILFVGNADRMESKEIPAKGYRFIGLHTTGLVGGFTDKAKAIALMSKAYFQAKKIIKEFKPDIAIGFGGYVSAPVMMAAHHYKIKVMIHEQNSIVGKANQLVMNKVDKIITCYTKCEEVFPGDKTILLGNPRATIAKEASFDEMYFKSLGLSLDKKTILIMMGSLGSSSVNALMKDSLTDMPKDLQFLYVCGKNNSDDLHLFDSQENVFVVPYEQFYYSEIDLL